VVGREAVTEFWKSDFQEGNPITLLTVTHSVEGFDTVLVHGNYQVVDRDTGSLLGFGRYAHIWHNTAAGWQLDQDLWNQPWE